MFGFVFTKKENIDIDSNNYQRFESGDYVCLYNPLNRFENDKLFFEDEKKIYLLDGVVFNKHKFEMDYNEEWSCAYKSLVESNVDFMDSLRGSFCGLIVDKESGNVEAFTNHSGEHTVYYTSDETGVSIFSNILFLKECGYKLPIEPDSEGCLELLSVGGVLHGLTPYKGVRRLMAGKRLNYSNKCLNIFDFHTFSNSPETDMSFEQCIDRADELFLQAVKRIFDKNQEYGYRNECDLSGGLDSRLAFFAARKLGFSDILNICYSQSGSLDHTVSKKICEDNKGEYVFIQMDGNILKNLDVKTTKTGGQIDYILYSGAMDACERIKDKNIGITCMGLLGEICKAEYVQGDAHTVPDWCGNNRTSLPYYYPKDCACKYKTYEELNLYERGFNIIVSSIIARQQYVEAYSPFVDPDFMEFILSIPVSYRKDCRFEIEWMKEKYPEAAAYTWQRSAKPLKDSTVKDINNIGGSIYGLTLRAVNKLCRKVKFNRQIISKYDMGPVEKWYINDVTVREYFDIYYEECIDKVTNRDVKSAIEFLWKSEQPYARAEVVNLLSIYKNVIS